MSEEGESEADEEIQEMDIRKKRVKQSYDSEEEGNDMELDDSVGSDGEAQVEEDSFESSEDEGDIRRRLVADSDSGEAAADLDEDMSDN